RLDRAAACRAGEEVRVARVAPERMGLRVCREPGVVAPEGAESVRLRELGRRRHRRARHALHAPSRRVTGAREADIRVAGLLVRPVLAVVVGGRELGVLGEGDPLPPLVGRGLAGVRVDALQGARVGSGARARRAYVAGYAAMD